MSHFVAYWFIGLGKIEQRTRALVYVLADIVKAKYLLSKVGSDVDNY